MATLDLCHRTTNNNRTNRLDTNNLHLQRRRGGNLVPDIILHHLSDPDAQQQHTTVADHDHDPRGDDHPGTTGALQHHHLTREPGDKRKSTAAGDSTRNSTNIVRILEETTKDIELVKSVPVPTPHLPPKQRSKILSHDKGKKIGHLRGQLYVGTKDDDKGTFS